MHANCFLSMMRSYSRNTLEGQKLTELREPAGCVHKGENEKVCSKSFVHDAAVDYFAILGSS